MKQSMDMSRLMRQMSGEGDEDPPPPVAKDIDAVRLRDAYAAYQKQHSFKVGDLIRRKGGTISNHPVMPPTGFYIVIDVFPVIHEKGPALDPHDLQSFGLCLDLYLGFYDEDGDFQFAPSDSRRYEPVPEEDIVP